VKTQPKIDKTDAKILRMLLAESRTSFTDIAKECKITVGAVRMRYKRLWRLGIVNGEIMLVNPHALGYRHIIDLGIICERHKQQETAEYLESKPYIFAIVRNLGNYNFYGKAALKDLNKLSDIVEDLEQHPEIKHVDSLIWAEAKNIEYPQNIIIIKPLGREESSQIQRPPSTDLDQPSVKIEEVDRKIVAILTREARTPFRTIAEQLGLSTKTVILRYKKLRENLLTLATLSLDLNKLGYQALANIYISAVRRSQITHIYNQLLKVPNVIVIIRLITHYDLYVAVALEDFAMMFEAKEQIDKIAGVEQTDMIIVPMPHKWPLNLFPPLVENKPMPKYWSDQV
jgi:Lrp/AsnC family transcriptional regulator for asnA, asnC and gidA